MGEQGEVQGHGMGPTEGRMYKMSTDFRGAHGAEKGDLSLSFFLFSFLFPEFCCLREMARVVEAKKNCCSSKVVRSRSSRDWTEKKAAQAAAKAAAA